jgi:hypothetical protein
MRKWLLCLILLSLAWAVPVQAKDAIQVLEDRAVLSFPESASFQAELRSTARITSVVLEYGVDQLNCGTVVARAFPEFEPALTVEVSWTWEMLQSGSLPPGAVIWWHWVVTDSSGARITTPQQTTLWLDEIHSWQTVQGGNINLHYYAGGAAFGDELHASAVQALARLSRDVDLHPEQPIDLYIYADTADLREAILYEPSWTGGLAYAEHNIVIIGIAPDELEWGKRTEAHELTHVLIGHLTFSCLGSIPTWLSEGLAMYGEGGLEGYQQDLFDRALQDNSFPSLRSLGGGFSEESERASLSYAMSFSVVDYLLQEFGRQAMTGLLLALRDGAVPDEALQSIYGFDTDGLEAAWRSSIGAPGQPGTAAATPLPTATVVPTIAPFSGGWVVPAGSTPGASPTPGPSPTPGSSPAAGRTEEPERTSLADRLRLEPELLALAGLGGLCCLVGLAGLAGIFFLVRPRSRRSK